LAGGLKVIEEALKLTPRRESAADYEMLESETRLLCNLVKMSAWQVEGELARIVGNIWQGGARIRGEGASEPGGQNGLFGIPAADG
jgi:hypothetical protein